VHRAKIGPGGRALQATFPAQAQVAAWARGGALRARLRPNGPAQVIGPKRNELRKKKNRAGPQLNSDRGWAKIETEIDFLFLFFQKLC
jgi:hypothetical protein